MTAPQTDLRAQFVAAAQRLIDRRRRRRLRVIGGAAALLAVVGVLAIFITHSPPPAMADVFDVSHEEEQITITVLNQIKDADAAREELKQGGVQADVHPVPTPSYLTGRVVSVEFDSGAIDVTMDGPRVESVRLPSVRGRITLYYGRAAQTGESYQATGSPPDCEKFANHIVSTSVRTEIADEYGPFVRWLMQRNGVPESIDETDLSPASQVVDIHPLSPNEVLVIVTDGDNMPAPGTTCGSA